MSENLALNLTRTAAEHPDEIACKLDDAAFNYQLLDNASARIASMLAAKGIEEGDRVAIMLPNVPYFPAVYYGILRCGAVVVPMNVLLKAREVAYYLEDSGAELIFAWHGFLEAAEKGAEAAGDVEVVSVVPGEFEGLIFAHDPNSAVAEVEADDTAVILYTSGTTGKPKGAELTHANLRKNVTAAVGLFGLGVGDMIFAGPAAVSLLRPDLHDERRRVQRRRDHAAAALRSRQGARDPRARRLHGVRRRPDDVRRAAAPPRPRQGRRLDAARLRVGRCVDARRGHARLRGGVRLQDPRGLRPVGDLAGRVVQPPRPRAQARLDRHAARRRRVPARRRRRQRRRARARSARSSSRATTS